MLESEGERPPPEGIDPEQVNPDFAASPVFGPGSSGTFDVTFEEGHTYAALCFISGPRGRPAPRDPAPDVRRVPGRCRR